MVEITSLSDGEEVDENTFGTVVLPNQVALRGNREIQIKVSQKPHKSKKSCTERIQTECCGSDSSSLYDEYDTSHYHKLILKRRKRLLISIVGAILDWVPRFKPVNLESTVRESLIQGIIALGAGLVVYFTKNKREDTPPILVSETSRTITTTLAPTTTSLIPEKSTMKPWYLRSESTLSLAGVFGLALTEIFGVGLTDFLKPTTTTTTTTTTTPPSTWGDWSACSPAHDCLDTVLQTQSCPVRTRSGQVWKDGQFIDVKQDTTDGCNCEPCTFRLTDWTGGDCTRDPSIAGGGGDCPCHWTQYRYCQQIGNGTS